MFSVWIEVDLLAAAGEVGEDGGDGAVMLFQLPVFHFNLYSLPEGVGVSHEGVAVLNERDAHIARVDGPVLSAAK